MKPYEQFVENILGAVRSGQGKYPAAATALIQDALRTAGLMPGAPSATPFTAEAPARAPFVDLNGVPDWLRRPATAKGTSPSGDWRARLDALRPRPQPVTPDAPGQFLEGSFSNSAGTRRYRLYVPAKAASGPRPLVVMLHGCQQSAADFAAGTAMNRLAEEHDCLVLYPDQERSANSSNCWNWFDATHQQREQGEPSLLAGMTRKIVQEHGADPRRVYIAGLSAGGAMAAVMGAAYPELYAAVGVHSGLPVGAARDLMSGLNAMKGKHLHGAGRTLHRRVPLIVFHGDQDVVVHPSNGTVLIRQFLGDGTVREIEERGTAGTGRGHTRTTALDDAGRAVAEHWVVHGAGHAWAGGDPAGSYTDAAGPDASAEMLRFFLSQAGD
ncbi:MAG: alpha/beta hydrolase family esterase [Massilia sp.]